MEVYNCSDITLCDLPIEVARGKALTEQFHTVHFNFDAAPAAVTSLVPPYVRKTRTLEAALPWLYLKGVSSGEMGSALKVLLGHDAKGLSANTVSRLKRDWAK